ncbi:M23 family metallopeptidase [Rhodohalobacter sp.]|uniref:M23 family metallopeptidase n=1 Tax=Rhodohalobacter sp. TaxID=1974210 RepID=UPI002ACD2EBE|nr:M23 family metallopeptidase [Rhodohalobacter sp.]MDZ7757918.1 M23 family metallopeptidase [Rhodohalobacter sp.]
MSLLAQENPVSFLSDSTEYAWPTDATEYLSSTFGETRSAHLHSGIDIRTWGQEGYRVFASRDGEVHRIGIGPEGYGYVIYLKHSDGSYTVYAHLNRFEPELQSFADSMRLQDYSFELDHTLENERIEYKKGDIIGYTGSTGVGPPHLHFEIRDPDFNAVNPLLTNLSRYVSDQIPPIFTQLGIEYLDTENYRYKDFELFPATKMDDGFDFGEIEIEGPVGLSVNVHDKANRAPNSYAVYSLMMVHKSDTLFHSVKNIFSLYHSGDMFLDRSYPILSQTGKGFQRLYKVYGNRLPIYKKTVNEGVLHLDDGIYPVQIIAKDIYGNESVATVKLNVNRTEKRAPINYVASYPAPETVSNKTVYDWLETTVVPTESLLASAGPELVTPDYQDVRFYYSDKRSVEKSLIPNTFDQLHTADQKLWIRFPSGSLYDTLSVRMDVIQTANQIDIELSPTELPLSGSANFNYILPDDFKDRTQLALFSVDPFTNRETFISTDNSSGLIRASIDEITNLRIREDQIAPWVGWPEIAQNLAGMHIVRIPLKDGDTGIDYKKSSIIINDEQGIIEYDPEENHLIYYNPDFEPKSINRVDYRIYDGVGNLTSQTVEIRYNP